MKQLLTLKQLLRGCFRAERRFMSWSVCHSDVIDKSSRQARRRMRVTSSLACQAIFAFSVRVFDTALVKVVRYLWENTIAMVTERCLRDLVVSGRRLPGVHRRVD